MPDLPPYMQLLKLVVEPDPAGGAPLIMMPGHDGVMGRPGFLHGGAIAGLCEYAAFTSLRAALGEEPATLKPITVTVDYMRGGRMEATHARGEILRLGRRIANVEVRAWQDDEHRPIAVARMNFKLERGESDG